MLFSAAAEEGEQPREHGCRRADGEGARARRNTEKREGTSEEYSDSQPVDKEAPSMQIKCCFHNHSSVPLSEVRFARSPGSLSSR